MNYSSIFIDRIATLVYKYSFRCIQSSRSPRSHAEPHAGAGRGARRRRRRHRLHRAGTAAAAGAASRRAARRSRPRRGASRRPGALPALAQLWDGAITPLDAGRAGARGRRRVSGAARHGGGRARAGAASTPASASSTSRARSGCATQALRARGGIRRRSACRTASPTASPSASATRCAARGWSPTRAAIRRRRCSRSRRSSTPACWSPGADVIVDAKSGVSGAGKTPSERTHFSEVHGSLSAYGVFSHRHGAEIEQGLGRDGHVHAAPGAARPRHPRDDLRARRAGHDRGGARRRLSSARTRTRPFVRLVGAALPEIKHVAHTNFCDIGWRVDPSGRVDPRVGHRQPAEGRVGPGRAEHERHARRSTRRPDCCERASPLARRQVRRRAARGSRRGSRRSSPPIARDRGGGRRRSSSSTAAARKSTRRSKAAGIEKRQVDGLRITDEPTLDVVVAVLAGAVNTRFVAALTHGRRAGGRADRRGRRLRPAPTRRRRIARWTAASSISAASAFRRDGADMRLLTHADSAIGFVPVIACIGLGADGRLFNVNADTFAGHLAARLGARRLVIAGTTRRRAGRRGRDDSARSIRRRSTRLISDGTATAGMIAKLRACEHALGARRRRRGHRGRPRRRGARSGGASAAAPANATRLVGG